MRDAAKEHTPDGESALNTNGQLPRIHPDDCHKPDADVNVVANKADEQIAKRSDSINVIRYGVSTQTTTQK